MCYHDGSYGEQLEGQYGSPENAPDGIPARDVDTALRRIGDEAQRLWSERSILGKGIVPLMDTIREERHRLGLAAEITA